ncbi:MAG TPA: ABC transporter substrate-binding protein [Ktedonobacterales bacterium]|nr:ABC transporter substrate-binding protein [Ktedonobacterales bacterium]
MRLSHGNIRGRLAAGALAVALLSLALAACGSTASGPLFAKDATGAAIAIPAKAPQKIISLGATDSEILGALNVTSRVIGVDAFTDYPADMAAKPKVTDENGRPNIEQIVALQPDLVLGYGREETTAADLALRQAHIYVVDLPNLDLSGSLQEIRLVGQLVHEEAAANTLVSALTRRVDAVKAKVKGHPNVSVYMEADDSAPGKPYVFGGGSFGDEIIRDAGGTNIFATNTTNAGFPQVGDEAIIAANPQVIILTEDPNYGGNPADVAKRPGYTTVAAVKNARVYQLNTDLFQRPGPRAVDALEQLAKLLHPDLFS